MYMELFSLSNGSGFSKNVIMFGVDNSSSVHVNNRKKIIILGKTLADGWYDTTMSEAEYPVNISK